MPYARHSLLKTIDKTYKYAIVKTRVPATSVVLPVFCIQLTWTQPTLCSDRVGYFLLFILFPYLKKEMSNVDDNFHCTVCKRKNLIQTHSCLLTEYSSQMTGRVREHFRPTDFHLSCHGHPPVYLSSEINLYS